MVSKGMKPVASESAEAANLRMAYGIALKELEIGHQLDGAARGKLTQIILAIVRKRVLAGDDLDNDCIQEIATTAASRLLGLSAG